MFYMLRVHDQFNRERFVDDLFDQGGVVNVWNNWEAEALCVRHFLGGHLADTLC